MFKGKTLPPKVYATTAANAEESSWGTYCPMEHKGSAAVNGVDLETCLGDLYSVSWMEDTDAHHGAETLGTQLADVKKRTNKSHVMEFGSADMAAQSIGDFLGEASPAAPLETGPPAADTVWNVRGLDLRVLEAVAARPGAAPRDRRSALPERMECELALHYGMPACSGFDARSGFALQFQRIAVNLCADDALGWGAAPQTARAAADAVCRSQALVV